MSGARHAASFHLFFKNFPRSTTSEQTNQLDKARIDVFITSNKWLARFEQPKRSLPQLAIASLHLRAIEPRLQEQWM
jgi:hypothetical protein